MIQIPYMGFGVLAAALNLGVPESKNREKMPRTFLSFADIVILC